MNFVTPETSDNGGQSSARRRRGQERGVSEMRTGWPEALRSTAKPFTDVLCWDLSEDST